MSDKIVVHIDKYGERVEVDTESDFKVFITVAERNKSFETDHQPTVALNAKQVKAIRKQLKQWLIENGHKDA